MCVKSEVLAQSFSILSERDIKWNFFQGVDLNNFWFFYSFIYEYFKFEFGMISRKVFELKNEDELSMAFHNFLYSAITS